MEGVLWGTSWIPSPFSVTTVPILLHPDLPVGSAQALILTHCRVTVLNPIPLPSFLQRCDHVFPNETQSCKPQSQHLCPRETELRHYGMPSIPCSPQLAMSPHPGPPGRTETTFVNSSTPHDPTSTNVSLSLAGVQPWLIQGIRSGDGVSDLFNYLFIKDIKSNRMRIAQ